MQHLSIPNANFLSSSSYESDTDHKGTFTIHSSRPLFSSFPYSPTSPQSPNYLQSASKSSNYNNNNTMDSSMTVFERAMLAAATASAATVNDQSVYYDDNKIIIPSQSEDENNYDIEEQQEEEEAEDSDYVEDKKGKRKPTKKPAAMKETNTNNNSPCNQRQIQSVPFSKYDPYRDYDANFYKESKEPFAVRTTVDPVSGSQRQDLASYYPVIGRSRRHYRGKYTVNGTDYSSNWLLGYIVPVSMDLVKFNDDKNAIYGDEQNIVWSCSTIPCIFIGGSYRLPRFLKLDSSIVTPAEKQFLFTTWLIASRNPFVSLSKKYSWLTETEEMQSDIGYVCESEVDKTMLAYPFAKEHCQLSFWANLCECITFYYGSLENTDKKQKNGNDIKCNKKVTVLPCKEGVNMPRCYSILGWSFKTTAALPMQHVTKCLIDLYTGPSLVDLLSERPPELLSEAINRCNPEYHVEDYVNLLKLDNEKFLYEVTKSESGRKTVKLLKAYSRYISVQKGWLNPSQLDDENALYSVQFTPCPAFSKAKELLGSSSKG